MPELIKKLINIPTSTKKLIEYKEVNITAKELVPSVLPIPAFDIKTDFKKIKPFISPSDNKTMLNAKLIMQNIFQTKNSLLNRNTTRQEPY